MQRHSDLGLAMRKVWDFPAIVTTTLISFALCAAAAFLIRTSIVVYGRSSYCYVAIVAILFVLSHAICAWVAHVLRGQLAKETI